MKRKITIIGIVFVLIIESVFIYNLFKQNKSQILQDIKTVDIFDNKDKTLSIMIQNDETFKYEEDTSRTTWPSRDEYMYAGSKCTDVNGTDLGDTTPYISFEETNPNPTVTIKTKKTIYCTLYFANARPVLETLDKRGGIYYGSPETTTGQGEMGNRQTVDGLIRFKGTKDQVTNNYICLGEEENPDKCKENKDDMYRIMGVTTNGLLKVIKASPTPSLVKWWEPPYISGITSDRKWNATDIYTYLKGSFYNSLNSKLKALIASYTWNMEMYDTFEYAYCSFGPWPSVNPTSGSIRKDGTVGAKVGLMYATDYVNAYNNSSNNWLYIKNGLTGNTATSEWTMTRAGSYSCESGSYGQNSWIVTGGRLSTQMVNSSSVVRPVFFLQTSKIGLIGFGEENHPYTISAAVN